MANITSLKKYLGYRFSSGGVIGDDFKSFSTKLRNYIKKVCDEHNLEFISFNRGHYECSGFLKSKNGQFVYWHISDVRHFQDEWYNSVLYRLATHEKDYRGAQNHYASLFSLGDAIEKLITSDGYYCINGETFTKRKLMSIGTDLASLWGGECYGFEIDDKEQIVRFNCIEHGESFVTTQSFLEL